MSSFPSDTIFGPAVALQAYAGTMPVNETPADAKPTGQGRTGAQIGTQGYAGPMGGIGSPWLAGYARAPVGCLPVWRLMDSHPTLALARYVTIAPVISGTRTVMIRTPDGTRSAQRRGPIVGDGVKVDPLDIRADFARSVFDPLWSPLVRYCCRALSLGHYAVEVVWGYRNNKRVITEFLPLVPEYTQLMVIEDTRQFAGVRNVGQNRTQDLSPLDCFVYTNDAESVDGSLYGRPRHENCREEWYEKINAKWKSQQLDQKATSVVPIVKGPSQADVRDANGNAIPGARGAETILNNLRRGDGAYLNHFLATINPDQLDNPEYLRTITELLKLSAYSIESFDMGESAPQAAQILAKIRYIDSELFMAWHRPPRSALEGEHGTLAEAEAHGDIGTLDSEQVGQDICAQVSAGPLDNLLEQNYGPDARGSVYFEADPLSDPQVSFFRDLVKTMVMAKGTDPSVQDVPDWKKVCEKVNLPTIAKPPTPAPEPAKPIEPPKPNPPEPRQKSNAPTMLSRLAAWDASDALILGRDDQPRDDNGRWAAMGDFAAGYNAKAAELIGADDAEMQSHADTLSKAGGEVAADIHAKADVLQAAHKKYVAHLKTTETADSDGNEEAALTHATEGLPAEHADLVHGVHNAVDLKDFDRSEYVVEQASESAMSLHDQAHPDLQPHIDIDRVSAAIERNKAPNLSHALKGERSQRLDSFAESPHYDEALQSGVDAVSPEHRAYIARHMDKIENVASVGRGKINPDRLRKAKPISLSREEELTGGAWKTINGARVYIRNGSVVAGPKHLIGKSPAHVQSHGAAPYKISGYHPIPRDATGAYTGGDPTIAERLKQYKPQPGWSHVHLNEDPEAAQQIKAKDSKGRDQSIRTEAATKAGAEDKWARNKEFHKALPAIRERMKADLGGHDAEEAAVLSLVDKTGFRIGSKKDTGAKVKAYGASTLNDSHVKIEGDTVHFDFIAKEGIRQQHSIHDPELAAMISPRLAKGGNLFDTSEDKSSKYLKRISGQSFSNKDFRTEVAAETARKTIANSPKPDTIAGLKKAKMDVATVVSKRLGNKPKQALESYIPPETFRPWKTVVANHEQAKLIAAHIAKTGMSENAGGMDWITKHAKTFREKFEKDTA